jgi:sugar-specific transcriptional regulator TrmB
LLIDKIKSGCYQLFTTHNNNLIMKLIDAIKEFGLTENEAEVYLTLIRTAGSQPASVIAQKMGMNRTTAYKILIHLSKLGLATKTMRHGILCFFVEDPEEKLKSLVEEKQSKLEEVNDIIMKSLPSLTIDGDFNEATMPKIRYYEGVDGIKQIYEAVLKEGKDYYRYGDITKIYGTLGEFTDEYIKKRNKIGITAHAIMPYYERSEEQAKKDKKELRKSLYIPHELFPIDGEVRIFGNKVAIFSLRKESPIGVIIESEIVANMFKSIFMLTWKDYTKKAFKI